MASISMNSAMETLSQMFPKINSPTIKHYLYETEGHMERTIELLLNLPQDGTSVNINKNNNNNNMNNNNMNKNNINNNMNNNINPNPQNNQSLKPSSSNKNKKTFFTEKDFHHNLPQQFLRIPKSSPQLFPHLQELNLKKEQIKGDQNFAKQLQRQMLIEAYQEQEQLKKQKHHHQKNHSHSHNQNKKKKNKTKIEGNSSSSNQSSTSSQNQQNPLKSLSGLAVTKLKGFFKKFGNSNTGKTRSEYLNLLRDPQNDEDDEEELKEFGIN